MPIAAAHSAAAVANTPRRPANGFCHRLGRAAARMPAAATPPALHCCSPRNPAQNAFRRERQFAKAHAGRIEDGVGDGRCTRDGGGLADAERRLVLPRQHQHVDLGHFGEFDDGVGAPFARRHGGAVERDFLHQRAAGRLDDVAVDLVADAVRIDHQAGILPGDHARHADIAGRLVDGDVGDPGRPRRAVARKLAVDIERIGKAAPAHDVALGFRFLPDRPRLPAGALGHRVDEIDRARVLQIAQAVFDRIDAGFDRRSSSIQDSCAKVFGSAETPRNQEARTIGGMSFATTRRLS